MFSYVNNGFIIEFGFIATSVSGNLQVILPLAYTTNSKYVYATVHDWDDNTLCSVTTGFPDTTTINLKTCVFVGNWIVYSCYVWWLTIGV